MWMLSCARQENGTITQAALAGVFVTAAGALRYEAWELIPLFGLILLKKWRSMAVFFVAALIFPVFWTIGNYLDSGDPLYSMHWAMNWNINVGQKNAHLTSTDYIDRATYFARSLFFGLTPLAFLVCLYGVFSVIYRRGKQWVWLIPLTVLFAISTWNEITGNEVYNFRYSLSVAILLIPFAAEWFESLKNLRGRWLVSSAVIITMVPLAFVMYMVPWPYYFRNPMPPKPAYIPRQDAQTVHESEALNREIAQYPGGLILDFHDWATTYYIALTSKNATSRIHILPGEENEQLDLTSLDEFIKWNPKGMLLATSKPRYFEVVACAGNKCSVRFKGRDQILYVDEVEHTADYSIYRYSANAIMQ
jgi:hypothetical protein